MGSMDQEMIAAIALMSLVLIMIAFIIVTIVLWKKVNKVTRKYDAMIASTGVSNLEEVIIQLQNKMSTLQSANSEHEQSIQQMKSKLSLMKGNVFMQRYNAFSEAGSDQSFSIAIVDDQLNGLVLTSIHGREETYSYGKPLIKGESKYPLSPEEQQVINSALNK